MPGSRTLPLIFTVFIFLIKLTSKISSISLITIRSFRANLPRFTDTNIRTAPTYILRQDTCITGTNSEKSEKRHHFQFSANFGIFVPAEMRTVGFAPTVASSLCTNEWNRMSRTTAQYQSERGVWNLNQASRDQSTLVWLEDAC